MLLLLFLFLFPTTNYFFASFGPDRNQVDEKVFVEISGEIAQPGVYGFQEAPDIGNLLVRAGELSAEAKKVSLPFSSFLFHTGKDIHIKKDLRSIRIMEGEMSAFYKITLGIPISINRATPEGLTAVSGIGPRIADIIVRERDMRGGFKSLDEVLSIKKISRGLFHRIRPYLVL